jgi:hypothetical protein
MKTPESKDLVGPARQDITPGSTQMDKPFVHEYVKLLRAKISQFDGLLDIHKTLRECLIDGKLHEAAQTSKLLDERQREIEILDRKLQQLLDSLRHKSLEDPRVPDLEIQLAGKIKEVQEMLTKSLDSIVDKSGHITRALRDARKKASLANAYNSKFPKPALYFDARL